MTLLPPKSTRTDTLFPDTTLFRSIVAPLNLRIGGKCGPLSGDPLDLRVTVRAIVEQHSQVGLNLRYPLGIGVWLQADNDVDIVLITHRSQVLALEAFEGLGIAQIGRAHV